MTDQEPDKGHDPLLVRPFLLHEPGGPSQQTWPSATTREVRSQHAIDSAPPPEPVPAAEPGAAGEPHRPAHAAPRRPRPAYRRALVVSGVVAGVVVTATVAGFAALRLHDQTPMSASPGYSPLAAPTAAPVPAGTLPAAGTAASRVLVTPSGHPAAGSSSVAGSASPAGTQKSPTGAPPPPGGVNPTHVTTPPGTAPASPQDGTPPATVPPQPPPSDEVGVLKEDTGLCLDLNGGVAVDDNHIQVYDCNGTDAQRWTLATDGTLRVQGKCALITGDASVHIVTCDGRTTAQWRAIGPVLVNLSDGRCLTDPSRGTASGTGVTVTTCSGDTDQRWSLT